MDVPRFEVAGAAIRDRVYVVGGVTAVGPGPSAVVEAYGHANLGFTEKDLRRFADKAGIHVASSGTVTRERRPPHFEVISLLGSKP